MRKRLLIVLLLLSIIPLVAGFDGHPVWGDRSRRVRYYGELVPFGALLDKGVMPHCHDGAADGVLTCYNTQEELAAATGLDLPDVDQAAVERLRSTGTVASVEAVYYGVVYEHIGFTGRSCALSLDYDDFRLIEFDNITSSIFIPAGAGWSRYYEHPYYGGQNWAFQVSVDDLRPIGCNDMISSAKRMSY